MLAVARPAAAHGSASPPIATVLPSAVRVDRQFRGAAHGFSSEMLYAYTSAAANNGSAFRRPHRQHLLVQCHGRSAMFFGRFFRDRAGAPGPSRPARLAAKKTASAFCRHLPDP